MDINIISCANSSCGIGRYTNELGKKLAHNGNGVTVLRKDKPQAPIFEVYPHRSFRSLRHYIAPYYLSKAISDRKPDVWLADYVDSTSAFSFIRKKSEASIFTNIHDAIPFLFPTSKVAFEFYKAQLKYAVRVSKKIIVVSEVSKFDLVKQIDIDPDKVEVIYNGINHDFFFPDIFKKENEIFTIRYVGGLSGPHKNAEALIEVARILEQKGYKFNMEIGGGHPENTTLPALVKKYNLKSVKFAGFIKDSDLRSFLAEADLFLYPSKYEGFGFPPLEAMACGTATVSSNAGSLEEVLEKGAKTVFPTPEKLATEVEKIILNPAKKKNMEGKAIAQAAKYTWNKSAKQHTELFLREGGNSRIGRLAS